MASLRLVLTSLLLLLVAAPAAAQVGIGTTVVDPSALLQLESTDRALLLPRLNPANVTGPVAGSVVYDNIAGVLRYYNGITWVNVYDDVIVGTSGLGSLIAGSTRNIFIAETAVPTNRLAVNTGAGPGAAPDVNATDGQVLIWNAANGRWQPGTAGGATQWLNDPPNDIYYAAGNVGIGFNNPTERLHVVVASPGATGGGLINNTGAGANSGAYLRVTNSAVTSELSAGTDATNNGRGGIGTTTNHPFRILTNNTERVYVTATGNVGVGTATPTFPLEVLTGGTNGTATNALVVGTTTINAGSGPVVQFRNNPTGGSGYLAAIAAIDDGGADGRLEFRTSNDDVTTAGVLDATSNRMTISQIGHVGIGTYPVVRLHVVDSDNDVNTNGVQFTNLSGTAGVAISDNQIRPFTVANLILRPANTGFVNTYRQDLLVDPSNDIQYIQRIQRESTNNNPQTGYGVGSEYWLEVTGNTLVNTARISSVLTDASASYQSVLNFDVGESSTGLQTRMRVVRDAVEVTGGAYTFRTAPAAAGVGADTHLDGGAALSGNNNGGNAVVHGGYPAGTGQPGNVILAHDGTNPMGRVGIGTIAPNSLLHVVSNATTGVGFLTQIHAFSATSGTGLSVSGGFTNAGSFQSSIANGTGVLASASGTNSVGLRAQGNLASAFLTGDVIFESTGADGVIRGQTLASGPADNLRIEAGNSSDDQGGNLNLAAGNSTGSGFNGGNVTIRGGFGQSDGGYVLIEGGSAGNNSGGDVFVTGGPLAMGTGVVRIGFRPDGSGGFEEPTNWQLGLNGTVQSDLIARVVSSTVPNLGAGSGILVNLTVPGARVGDFVIVQSVENIALNVVDSRVTANNVVQIAVYNVSTFAFTSSARQFRVLILR